MSRVKQFHPNISRTRFTRLIGLKSLIQYNIDFGVFVNYDTDFDLSSDANKCKKCEETTQTNLFILWHLFPLTPLFPKPSGLEWK